MMDSLQRDVSSFLSTNGLQYLQRHFHPFCLKSFLRNMFPLLYLQRDFPPFLSDSFPPSVAGIWFPQSKAKFYAIFISNKFPQSAAGIWLPLSIARFSTKFFVKNFPPSVLQEYYGELTFSPLQMGNFLVLFVNYA